PQQAAEEPHPDPQTCPGEHPTATQPLVSSDACYFCGRRVYILERASAEGHFFHRGCFQCWQCGATLRLGDYAFHEEDGEQGHFYCLFHDPNAPGMDMPPSEPPVLPDGVSSHKSP
uniref:LIM zinc-binding domain-containing protein n=1 Tax=Anas platyrhynchos platyrhynchos TaxID=8840 RepID=A0A493TMW4_ANAPP